MVRQFSDLGTQTNLRLAGLGIANISGPFQIRQLQHLAIKAKDLLLAYCPGPSVAAQVNSVTLDTFHERVGRGSWLLEPGAQRYTGLGEGQSLSQLYSTAKGPQLVDAPHSGPRTSYHTGSPFSLPHQP